MQAVNAVNNRGVDDMVNMGSRIRGAHPSRGGFTAGRLSTPHEEFDPSIVVIRRGTR